MKKIIISLFTITSICLASAQSKLTRYIDSFTKKNNFNGTILVKQNNKITFHKSYGYANLEWKVPNSTDTKYKVASITKFFTSILIMQLVEEGKVDLNKPIHHYLKDYRGDKTITILQLLNHTSGMKNMDTITSAESAIQNGLPPYQHPFSAKQLLERFASDTLATSPGGEFSYNNADYIILGNIIEQVTGQSYEQVLNDKILTPLQMNNSGLLSQSKLIDNLASTYFIRDDINKLVPDLPVYWENWYAAGAMYSTTKDLLKFCNAVFTNKLLRKSSLDLMFVSGKGEYGFGVWVYLDYTINKKDYTIVKRPGQIMGAQSMIFYILETGATIIILSNTGTTDLDNFAARLAELITNSN